MKITGKELIEKYDHLNEHGLVDQIREKRLTAINPISHEEVDWLEDEKLFNEVKRMAEKPLPPKTRGPNPYTEGQGLFVPIKDKPRHRLRVTQGAEDMSWFELHSRLMNKECNIPISRETWVLLRQDYSPGHMVQRALTALYDYSEISAIFEHTEEQEIIGEKIPSWQDIASYLGGLSVSTARSWCKDRRNSKGEKIIKGGNEKGGVWAWSYDLDQIKKNPQGRKKK